MAPFSRQQVFMRLKLPGRYYENQNQPVIYREAALEAKAKPQS